MMAAADETPAGRPSDDADARFAAYLADLAAHADEPHGGEQCRAVLADNPETRRAWFDVIEDMLSPVPPYASGVRAAGMLTLAVAVIALVLHAMGFHL